eukprot:79830-Amorphochlora_amoeboformis.AAC.1
MDRYVATAEKSRGLRGGLRYESRISPADHERIVSLGVGTATYIAAEVSLVLLVFLRLAASAAAGLTERD